jgi:hypothetical protein
VNQNQNKWHASLWRLAAIVLATLAPGARFGWADVYQWEYIDPTDPSQGTRPSTALAPGGAGVRAAPGVDLSSRDLTMAYFVDADLRNALFDRSILTSADFTNAQIQGAGFAVHRDPWNGNIAGTGISLPQLYSTESYRTGDLQRIRLGYGEFSGADFTGQNLAYANFASISFVATFPFQPPYIYPALLRGADFSGADVRGAFWVDLADAITANLIHSDGQIHGLSLGPGETLRIRDCDAPPWDATATLPVRVDQHFAMSRGGALRMVLEADDWGSTIGFAPDIPVALGGALELTFAADVNVASQVGRTFRLFDWTGVAPTGEFVIASPHEWNLANLYDLGEVTLLAVPEPHSLPLWRLAMAALIFVRRQPVVFYPIRRSLV